VALKLVKRDLAGDDIFRRRFLREAEIGRRVVHANLVPVIDSGEYRGLPYIVQRLMERGSLEERLRAEGVLDVSAVVKLCKDIAGSLDLLWDLGIVHRDLKPANILFDAEGTAYLTDFGLAKDTQRTVLTKPGQALGSIDYMAPEQIRAEKVGAASDVYALACVLFECLSGSPPFAEHRGIRVLWAHLQDEPPDLCEQRADLPREVADVIRGGLEKDPGKRAQSAGEFARLLEAAAGAASRRDTGG
jgi:serine/threonine-protein kinase